jgi:hypothetical protein
MRGVREMRATMTVEFPDGSKWGVPVMEIAKNRAEYYKDEFGNNLARSLNEDTIPLFEGDDYEIEDWATNNMNWSDVKSFAFKVSDGTGPDMQEVWMNGEKGFID